MALWIIVFLSSVILDQATKQFVISKVQWEDSFPVINNLIYISPEKNMGIHIGLLRNNKIIYLILILVVLCLLFFVLLKSKNIHLKSSVTLVAGGITGNLIDFTTKKGVTDFLNFNLFGLKLPNCNLADLLIVTGIVIFIYNFSSIFKSHDDLF
jgi:signal peptidase II